MPLQDFLHAKAPDEGIPTVFRIRTFANAFTDLRLGCGGCELHLTPDFPLPLKSTRYRVQNAHEKTPSRSHRSDGKVPVETIVSTTASAVPSGKERYLGLSECSSTSLHRATTIHAVQIEYSPFTLDIENASGTNLLANCRELGVATVAYSPLGRGMLTGRYHSAGDFEDCDWRRNMPRFSAENFPKNLVLVEKLAAVAGGKGVRWGS